MKVKSFRITDALRLEPLAPEEVVEACENRDARVWLDLQAVEPVELEEWLDRLNVVGLSRRLCLEAQDHPGFYPFNHEIFFVVPVLTKTAGQLDVDHLACLSRENLLLTLHQKPVVDTVDLLTLDASDAWLPGRSIAGLVAALMIDQSLECLRRSTHLRNSVRAVEERLDREPESVEVEEILDMYAELVTLGAVVSDQLPTLQALANTDKSFFRLADTQEYMNCALANLQASDGSLSWLDQRIGALRSGFQMHAQDKTNRRLNMLTILSAIFTPVTLLAGIWGMNFEIMPELKYPFAYPVALGLMVLIGWGMYLFFRRNDWLD
jgi:magnesium transporter